MPESTSSASENSLEGFGLHIKGATAASTRQELPLWEPRGVPHPFAALRACTKATSNGGNLEKKKKKSNILCPSYQDLDSRWGFGVMKRAAHADSEVLLHPNPNRDQSTGALTHPCSGVAPG